MGINTTFKEITREVEVTESLTCDDCGCTIPLVFPDVEGKTAQGSHALLIEFDGGYGMYIDPLGEPEKRAILCKDCADKLCAAHPWIEKLLHEIPV